MKNLLYFGLFLSLIMFNSCSDDDAAPQDETGNVNLNIAGLEDLGADYVYEGWIIVDGAPVSTGTFTVDANNTASQTSFEVAQEDLDNATTFVLSIEPTQDSDPAPSAVKILGGDFTANTATVTVAHGAALGNDFTATNGKYILATPTTSDMTDESSGVWFLDNSSGAPAAGLTNLPTLPDGWVYEGWAVIDGQPVTTGTFSSATGIDEIAPYSGSDAAGPGYPGEDFITNAPIGLTFPTDLKGTTIVVSIEPVPDNSVAPFGLKPLVAGVPATAMDHTPYDLDNKANTLVSGTVTKN